MDLLGTTAGILGAGSSVLAYSLFEARNFATREVRIECLPTGQNDLRILHLSDLHLTPAQSHKIKWLQGLAELKPDFTVVTGDFLAHQLAVPAISEALDGLLAGPGAFVLGSNDYYAPRLKNPFGYFNKDRDVTPKSEALPTGDLVEQLTDAGWHNLNNAQTLTDINGVRVHLRGTDDPHINLDRYELVAGPYEPAAFALGVTHAPYKRVLESFAQDETDLILAGHTHGGQVCIPFYGALVTNCDLPTSQAKGLSNYYGAGRETPMHVSAGVGTSPITPVRLACRPEATLLTLKAAGTKD
jgi:predicted MPP superfamily phosphohydrolase